MYYCMTEEQKKVIECLNMSVVKFKCVLLKVIESLKKVWDDFISVFRKIVCVSGEDFQKVRYGLTPRKHYKLVKRLNRCGFNEKEVNLMIFRVYRCRNNC